MPRPLKDPAVRQRRNRTTTAAQLEEIPTRKIRRPKLPIRIITDSEGKETELSWHPLVLLAWRDWWRSPMAAEWLRADWHGLYVVADLLDRYWRTGSLTAAAEYRQHRAAFGLTSMDRRRLQWEIQKTESRKPPAPGFPQAPPVASGDPRLRALK